MSDTLDDKFFLLALLNLSEAVTIATNLQLRRAPMHEYKVAIMRLRFAEAALEVGLYEAKKDEHVAER
jgi:hypothetical protein